MKLVVAALSATTLSVLVLSTFAAGHEAPRRHVVEIKNFKFVSADLTIRQGDTVVWVNRDIAPHTATKESLTWDTGNLTKDQSGEVTFSSPGTASYLCQYHPNMRGEITVVAN